MRTCAPSSVVREHIPLEQGLRHVRKFDIDAIIVVREHIPLEQGLRLVVHYLVVM